jgi:formylglycine-generating enzyme required for sulfatase activity
MVRTIIHVALLSLLILAGSVSYAGRSSDMVFIEGGEFMMGDVFGDGDDEQKPPHKVRLDSFYIGKHEVTVGEFRGFVEATGYLTSAETDSGALVFDEGARRQVRKQDACWSKPYHDQGDRHPVVCVSWYDAIAYCNWRSEKEGLEKCYSGKGDDVVCNFGASGYRMPTEAEWEYVARCRGEDLPYAWGRGDPVAGGRSAANIKDETFKARFPFTKEHWDDYSDDWVFTAPTGSFAPNDLGVHDLGGNAYEWCWDWIDVDYYDRSPVENPRGPESGEKRSCRDAGFGCPLGALRTTVRGYAKPDYRAEHVGFRLARTAD